MSATRLVVLAFCVAVTGALADDDAIYTMLEPTIAKCMNGPEARCNFSDFPPATIAKCIDNPASLCNNWTGAKISADAKAAREVAAKAGQKSLALVHAQEALEKKWRGIWTTAQVCQTGFPR